MTAMVMVVMVVVVIAATVIMSVAIVGTLTAVVKVEAAEVDCGMSV